VNKTGEGGSAVAHAVFGDLGVAHAIELARAAQSVRVVAA
jgi:hypothetical protein